MKKIHFSAHRSSLYSRLICSTFLCTTSCMNRFDFAINFFPPLSLSRSFFSYHFGNWLADVFCTVQMALAAGNLKKREMKLHCNASKNKPQSFSKRPQIYTWAHLHILKSNLMFDLKKHFVIFHLSVHQKPCSNESQVHPNHT